MEIGGTTLLVYFSRNGYDLERLKPYENFLLECKQKDIEHYAKHKHHILPVFMGGGNDADNFIVLTPEDHFKAHIILAECFEKRTMEYWHNIGASNLIIRNSKRQLKKLFGESIPTDLVEFWKQANLYANAAMKGEGNHMWGKTHDEEARAKISAAQKNRKRTDEEKLAQSKRMVGAGNPSYGKKRPHSPETIKILTEKSRQSNLIRFPMPEGVFVGEPVGRKRYWRYCPTCNAEVRYVRRHDAVDAQTEGWECRCCSAKTVADKLRGRKLKDTSHLKGLKRANTENIGKNDKFGSKNPNAKQVLDPETGKVYQTMKELSVELGVSVDVVRNKIYKGKYVYLGKTNSKEMRSKNGTS